MGGRRGALRLAPAASCSSGCGTVPGGGGGAHPCAFRAARARELRVALSRGMDCRPGRKARCLGGGPRGARALAEGALAGGRQLRSAAAQAGSQPASRAAAQQCFEIIAQYLFSFFSRGLAPFEICARLRRIPGAVRLVRRALPADPAPWPWGRWAEGLSAPWSARPGLPGTESENRQVQFLDLQISLSNRLLRSKCDFEEIICRSKSSLSRPATGIGCSSLE